MAHRRPQLQGGVRLPSEVWILFGPAGLCYWFGSRREALEYKQAQARRRQVLPFIGPLRYQDTTYDFAQRRKEKMVEERLCSMCQTAWGDIEGDQYGVVCERCKKNGCDANCPCEQERRRYRRSRG
jgi:hypothetical protein